MTRFRSALAMLVKQRLVVTRQLPPSEATEYKKCVLGLFCSKGPRYLERQRLLLEVLTGDWRLQDVVHVYIPPGLEVDLKQVETNVVEALTSALTRRKLPHISSSSLAGC